MSMVQILNVKLQRTDPSVSWGFNVQGGKEFHSPLLIQKVNPNSLAEKSSIIPGDYILRIGNIIAENFTHAQAREAILRQGNNLEMTLQRGAPPRSDDYYANFEFPKHKLMTPENVENVPIASPQVGIQLNKNKALLTQSYNSPMGLYSNQNIADTLVTTIKNYESQDFFGKKESMTESLSSSSLTSLASGTTSLSSPVNSNISNQAKKFSVEKNDSLNSNSKQFNMKKAENEVFEPNKYYQSVQIVSNENQENIIEPKYNPYTFRAVPFKPPNEINNNDKSTQNLEISQKSNFTNETKKNDSKDGLNLNEFKTELTDRLINTNHQSNDNKMKINGRLLLKNIESSINNTNKKIEENNLNKFDQELKNAISPKKISNQTYKLRNIVHGHVAKLDDPTKPSLIQSRTFKLLQETLDKGLSEKEAVFHDNITNKNHLRRCSLNINFKPLMDDQLENSTLKFNNLKINEQNDTDESEISEKSIGLFLEKYKPRLNTRSQSVVEDIYKKTGYSSPIKNKLKEFLNEETKSNLNFNTAPAQSNSHQTFRSASFSKPMNIKDPNILLQEAQKLKQTQVIEAVNFTQNATNEIFNTNKKNFSHGGSTVPINPPIHAPTHAPAYKPVQAPTSPASHSHYQYQQQPQQQNFPLPSAPVSKKPAGQRSINRGIKGSAIFNSNSSTNVPTCASCAQLIRGPFISAVGKIWCPNHFVCANPSCAISLQDIGFVEENGKLYCERDFEAFLAPKCYKCHSSILEECCYALEKTFHPQCFTCGQCKQKIGTGSFHIEDGVPYCERDFNALFSVKCSGCEFPIEAGDKFLEAINQKWHVECFICSTCNVSLQNTGFATKGNKPYCKRHAY